MLDGGMVDRHSRTIIPQMRPESTGPGSTAMVQDGRWSDLRRSELSDATLWEQRQDHPRHTPNRVEPATSIVPFPTPKPPSTRADAHQPAPAGAMQPREAASAKQTAFRRSQAPIAIPMARVELRASTRRDHRAVQSTKFLSYPINSFAPPSALLLPRASFVGPAFFFFFSSASHLPLVPPTPLFRALRVSIALRSDRHLASRQDIVCETARSTEPQLRQIINPAAVLPRQPVLLANNH